MTGHPDLIDRAAERTDELLAEALYQQRKRAAEPEQIVENGHVYCCDCGDQIARERLEAKPNAARCGDCQQLHENEQRRLRGGK
ncbi:MAG: TraR/DksA C4-type zinc finger protein [Gammaproteobacteria bacterium]|nr:TraR/DksA C4-type zinc finger protein [Gammaproteobacteria bacterium]